MIERKLKPYLKQIATKMPLVAVLGPRQSGKTTLSKVAFPNKPYVNLEDLEVRRFAMEDPKQFLDNYPDGAILDEIQHVPDLFSYLQVRVDANNKPGEFVLTGSQNFLLLEKITQSLAGRVAMLTLLPCAYSELLEFQPKQNLFELIFKGAYPRVYQSKLLPAEWYPDYITTYIQRDVRQIKNVHDLGLFSRFLKLCAGRVGQVVNLSSLANDCGIKHNTAKSWLSLLELSFVIFQMKPYHKNLGKQVVKSPKLYFYDTGIICSLLGVTSADQLNMHHMRGELFENFVITEFLKHYYNQGLVPDISYWRDKLGNEVDCVLNVEGVLRAVEIKSGKTINSDYFKGLRYWSKLTAGDLDNNFVIYGGDQNQKRKDGHVLSWSDLSRALYEK